MKKIINNIARYIVGAAGLLLLLLLACVMNAEKNRIAEKMAIPVLLLFLVSMLIFVIVYTIHAVWMLQEKQRPSRGIVISFLVLSVILLIINYFQNGGIYRGITGFLTPIFVGIFSEIGKYVYSWKEDDSSYLC